MRYGTCPLCGSLVQLQELRELGYCKICELLIEALKGGC